MPPAIQSLCMNTRVWQHMIYILDQRMVPCLQWLLYSLRLRDKCCFTWSCWHHCFYIFPRGAFNNKVEYEALIIGLVSALYMGIRILKVQGDSNSSYNKLMENSSSRRLLVLLIELLAGSLSNLFPVFSSNMFLEHTTNMQILWLLWQQRLILLTRCSMWEWLRRLCELLN